MRRRDDLVELKQRLDLLVTGSKLEDIDVSMPVEGDREALYALFSEVIRTNFEREGLGADHPAVPDLIAGKRALVDRVLSGDLEKGRFYLFRLEGEIVSTIEWGPPGHLIRELGKGRFDQTVEIGTVFIRPAFQRRGIGKLMLALVEEDLRQCGYGDYVLDSGYGLAQVYWTERLGAAAMTIPDYWGEDAPHMIWHVSLKNT